MKNENNKIKLEKVVKHSNTGLDAIRRAPIVIEETGIKCLRIQDVSQSKNFVAWGNTMVSDKDYRQFKLKKDDILISRTGASIGTEIFIDHDLNAVYNNGLIHISINNDADPLYIHYALNTREFSGYISGISSGTSTQPNMQIKDLLNYEINLPPLPEQKRISNILSSFDNKIELLRKENNTLEDIAQSIFKEWFVKYNFPNKDGKPYRDNNGKMIDSELGLIPEGWRVGKLGEIVEIKNGFAFKSENYRETGYPIIRTMNFEDTGYINNQSLVYLSEQKAKEFDNFNLNEFDLCVVMVGASLGKTALVTKNNLPALQNQNMWSFKPKKEANRFYNNLVLRDLIKQNLRSASGSAREFFRKDHFYSVDIIIPSDTMISNFDQKIRPMFQNISNNLQMVNTLSYAKKSLLAKLIKS